MHIKNVKKLILICVTGTWLVAFYCQLQQLQKGCGEDALAIDNQCPGIYPQVIPSVPFQEAMPHLMSNRLAYLDPPLLYKNYRVRRPTSKYIIAISSTISEKDNSSLISTLENLFVNIGEADKTKVQFIVLLHHIQGDKCSDTQVIENCVKHLIHRFIDHFNEALIEILIPPPEWYSNDHAQAQILSDMYLMIYASHIYPNAMYFIQTPDNVWTRPHYIPEIDYDASLYMYMPNIEKWLVYEFPKEKGSTRTVRMYRVKQLVSIYRFALMFYQTRPMDWIVSEMLEARTCHQSTANCYENLILGRTLVKHSTVLFREQPLKEQKPPGKADIDEDERVNSESVNIVQGKEHTNWVEAFVDEAAFQAFYAHSIPYVMSAEKTVDASYLSTFINNILFSSPTTEEIRDYNITLHFATRALAQHVRLKYAYVLRDLFSPANTEKYLHPKCWKNTILQNPIYFSFNCNWRTKYDWVGDNDLTVEVEPYSCHAQKGNQSGHTVEFSPNDVEFSKTHIEYRWENLCTLKR